MDTFGIDLDQLSSAFSSKELGGSFHSRIASKRPLPEDELCIIPCKKSTIKIPKFQLYTYPDVKGCLHEVIFSLGQKQVDLRKNNDAPAKTYPFSLDSFQTRAIMCIDTGQSVLVSAHTSAGKTVVAEYAIAVSLRERQRVIYTTPIKALSNQKFREFSEEFKDVGLMTGDITINPEASVLIMTTEILRSMLYRGSNVTREVGWVIFDEVHYMREKERGVVWEESMILLPSKVNMVFLSATIPNAREFAQWIVSLHLHPCHVVYTDYRPTPLQHYVFPCGGDGIHLVVNQKGEFIESNFNSAIKIVSSSGDNAKSDAALRGRKGGSQRATTYCFKLVKLVMDQHLEPLIVFSFSKKDCEFYAMQVKGTSFNSEKEKSAVNLIFNNAIASLSEEDRALPQVQSTLPLIQRGIGIHHGGLLPILKEVVEILFSEGLIKVLFATETFAMGLNMPARTVLFTATRKFDGSNFRILSPGEYIQMSGRAGRRGKDERGTVILMIDDTISSNDARQLLLGQPDPLNSAFHLTYTMVLNLLRIDDIDPETILQQSFYQFQNSLKLPHFEKQVSVLEDDLLLYESSLPGLDVDEQHICSYLDLLRAKKQLNRTKLYLLSRPKYIMAFLQPGRIISVSRPEGPDFGWGVVLNVRQSQEADTPEGTPISSGDSLPHVADCLLEVTSQNSLHSTSLGPYPSPLSSVEPASHSDLPVFEDNPNLINKTKDSVQIELPSDFCKSSLNVVRVVSVPFVSIAELSSVVLKLDSVSGQNGGAAKKAAFSAKLMNQTDEYRRQVWLGIERARNKLDGQLPILDPIKDMKIKNQKLLKCMKEIALIEARMDANSLSKRPNLDSIIGMYQKRNEKRMELASARRQLSNHQSLLQLDELIARKRVLRRLGFCSEDDVIQIKGRIACEISSGDELLLSELMLDGFFSNMQPDVLAAVLSCFVTEPSADVREIKNIGQEMRTALTTIHDKARYLFRVASDSRVNSRPNLETGVLLGRSISNASRELPQVEESYVQRFNGELMEAVRAWAQGVSFARICEMTKVYEGNIIRCMRRLEELLRQMHDAAKVTGNTEMENKFLQAMGLIKRDIVFAASLYL